MPALAQSAAADEIIVSGRGLDAPEALAAYSVLSGRRPAIKGEVEIR